MKWLKKILKKDEIPATVAFDAMDTWLEMASEWLFRGLNTNAEQIYEKIRDLRETLKQHTSELQDAEPNEDIPAPITKAGLPNRDKMVKHLYTLTEKISIPTRTDYKTVLSFYGITNSNIKFVFDKTFSKTIYSVQSLFPDAVKEVRSDLNRLRTLLDLLITPLKGKESQIKNLELVPEIVQDIKELNSVIEKEKENVCDQEEEYSALEKRIETEGERLKKIEEGEEWNRFKELETELNSVEEELNTLDSDACKLFSPINKALSLLKKQDETGRYTLTSEERKAVNSILSSPVQALDEDINQYLLSIRNIIGGDSAIIKERKRDMTLKGIDNLLNTDLYSIKRKRELLQSRIEEIKSTLSGMTILKERTEVEQSIVSAGEQINRLQEGTDRSKRRVVSLEEELIEEERLFSEALEEIAGKQIDVEFNF